MASSNDAFNPFAPGFDFLQKLTQAEGRSGAGAFPSWTDWVAPTMSVEELDKRISELKTVLFWLEQNQRALTATIQAMEVQKMTLSALQTMNVPVDNWASAVLHNWQQFAKGADAAASPAAPPTPSTAESAPDPEPEPMPEPVKASATENSAAHAATDPLNWWGALTQQFQHIAQQAVQDVTLHAMQHTATTQDAMTSATQSMAQPVAKRRAPAPAKRSAAAKTSRVSTPARKTTQKPVARKPAR